MAIPTNRAVLGKDLDAVRLQYGLLTSDACWLFGLSITKWTQVVRQAGEFPLKDPTLALLVRFLDQHPELSVIPRFPKVDEMFAMVNAIQETDQKRFSVLFGSEASAAFRWLKSDSRQSPAVRRLMHYMKSAFLARQPERRADLLEKWRATVASEAVARGVPDVFKTGNWNPKGVAEQTALMAAALPDGVAPTSKKGRAASKKKADAAAAPTAATPTAAKKKAAVAA
jgi:hypothetical protein